MPSRHDNSVDRVLLERAIRLVFSNYFLAVVGVIISFMLANSLGSIVYGEMIYALSIGGVVATVSRWGMDRTLTRDLIQRDEGFAFNLSVASILKLLLLSIVIISLLLLHNFSLVNIPSDGIWFIVATGLGALTYAGAFDALEKQNTHMVFSVVEKIAYGLFIYFFIYRSTGDSILNLIGFAFFLIVFVSLAYQFLYLAGKKSALNFQSFSFVTISSLRDLFCRNFKIVVATLATTLFIQGNKLILANEVGYEALAQFAIAIQVISLFMIIIKNLARVAKPRLAVLFDKNKRIYSEGNRFIIRYFCVMTGVCFALSAIVFFVSEILISQLFLKEYAPATDITKFLSLLLIFTGWELIFSQYINMTNRDVTYMVGSIIINLSCLAGSFIFTAVYGVYGAAVILMLAAGLRAIYYARYWVRDLSYN